jgi:hypothetical protein
MNSIVNKNSKLRFLDSPYFIYYSSNIIEAINIAIHNGLFNEYSINSRLINDYKRKKKLLPIWVAEAACSINSKYHKIPITYQNLWFCLHNTNITRTQPSGRKFRSKVRFAPCYISTNKKIRKLLEETLTKLNTSQRRFSLLCGHKYGSIRLRHGKLPITVILKICQVLKLNIWDLLENCELTGKTSQKGKITIPKNKEDSDIDVLLIWVRTEGHLTLSNTIIEINQKANLQSLKKLEKMFTNKFNLKNKICFTKGSIGEDRLLISSSPLRQLLCLKYEIPAGYKSNSLDKMNLNRLSKKHYQKMMAAFIQTEGCLSYAYTRNKKKRLPKFEFVVKDKSLANDCLTVLRKLGFHPHQYTKQNIFKVGLYDSNKVIDLVKQTKKYFFNKKKIECLKEACTGGIGL